MNNNKKVICFDVDGTLITYEDEPRWNIIDMLKTLSEKHKIIVWSGGGKDYAEVWVKRLFLQKYVSEVRMKPLREEDMLEDVDICFDDEDVKLATINVKI